MNEMSNPKSNSLLFSWLIDNIEESSMNDFIDLIEIKAKNSSEGTSAMSVGNLMKKIFTTVNVKNARSKDDWCKMTKRYYGVKWKKNTSTVINLSTVETYLPEDFVLLSKTISSVTIGHFSNTIINGMKVLTEVELKLDQTWNLIVMGKKVDPVSLGVDNIFNVQSGFHIVRQLCYCDGVEKVDKSKEDRDFFKEHVSKVLDENSEQIRYRSKFCRKVLPFKSSNKASTSCGHCKSLAKPVIVKNPKAEETTEEPVNENSNNTVTCKDTLSTITDQDLMLSKSDDNDMSQILNKIFPECSDKMKSFLMSQKMAIERNPHGRRWNRDIVRLCLTLWCRSPKGYTELRNSKFVMLPSEKLLQRFKNTVNQEAGINNDMLHWMANEAKLKNIPPEGYEGGLIIDEMSIQQDLQLKKINGNIELIGFTELSPESVVFDKLKSYKNERILASHVLQLVFLGSTGFRFPFSHFPSNTASGHELYLLVWKSVNRLMNFGFNIMYVSTDGAQTNRDLFKLLLPEFSSANPVTCSFNNIYSNDKISFIMDIFHVIKKIGNNILKSGSDSHCKRHLKFEGHSIEWNHFKRAYLWDISTHPFPVHHKLSQDHIYLTSEAKMRNHLAEDVLNAAMLHLMKLYQQSLGEFSSELNATVELLSNTSVLITNFRDNRAITDLSDDRLRQNHDAMDFFIKWEKSIQLDTTIKQKEICMISHQTRQDIVSSILGFEEFCKYRFKNNNASVIPSRLNSDVIENVFCQQRTLHSGANTNPTYLGYCYAMNSVILGQTTVSRKSNTGGDTAQPPTHKNPGITKAVLKEQTQAQAH